MLGQLSQLSSASEIMLSPLMMMWL